MTAGRRWSFRILGFSARFRIVQWGGDHVPTARPLAKINRAAPLTAERKLRFVL
jgi:hypothetical protein